MTKQYWIIIAALICALIIWRAPIIIAFIFSVLHDDAPIFLVGCGVGWFVHSRHVRTITPEANAKSTPNKEAPLP